MSTKKLLFISNLPNGFGTAELRRVVMDRLDHTGAASAITECEVLRGGIGFVEFESAGAAQAAKRALEYMPSIHDHALKVRWALGRAVLLVSDLSENVKQDELREAFKQWGDVLSCRVVHASAEEGGKSLGYGYVEYVQRSIAVKVQQLLSDNLFIIGNAPQPVRVDFACASANRVDPVVIEDSTPHFAQQGTLEYDFALKWRELSIAHTSEQEQLHELQDQERLLLHEEQLRLFQHERQKMLAMEGILRGSSEHEESNLQHLRWVLEQRRSGGA